MFKVFVRFTMTTDSITREREWNGLEKWAAHAVLGRIHRIAKERNYTIRDVEFARRCCSNENLWNLAA